MGRPLWAWDASCVLLSDRTSTTHSSVAPRIVLFTCSSVITYKNMTLKLLHILKCNLMSTSGRVKSVSNREIRIQLPNLLILKRKALYLIYQLKFLANRDNNNQRVNALECAT